MNFDAKRFEKYSFSYRTSQFATFFLKKPKSSIPYFQRGHLQDLFKIRGYLELGLLKNKGANYSLICK